MMIQYALEWKPPDATASEEVITAARGMVLSDLELMDDHDFINQKPSEIVMALADVIIETMQEQVEEIVCMKNMEEDMLDLGIEKEQKPVPYARVIKVVNQNHARGVRIIAYYLSIFEYVKQRVNEKD